MFARARRRLAIRYLILFTIVIVAFSLVFLAVLAAVLQPAFDIAPEVSNEEAARVAYGQTLERIALALVLADLAVLAVIGAAGFYLAGRTLGPIRAAHDRQRRFVADASHEMRGPLTAIRSTAEAALRSKPDAAVRQVALQTIIDEAAGLARLTTDLLVLARTEEGVLAATLEAVDFSVVVAEEVNRFRTAFAGPAPRVEVTLGEDLVVRADASGLARIIGNLLDNAARHGREPIEVRTFRDDRHAVAEVADHGAGVAAADSERIFEPFYRVRQDASGPLGSGLGLAIAAELAHRYDGRLTVASRPGAGARFRVAIPRLA